MSQARLGLGAAESVPSRLARWGLDDLLRTYPGLRLAPSRPGVVRLAGTLAFTMEAAAKVRISDAYEIELLIPDSFPDDVPLARETGKRIRHDFHRLTNGYFCLGAPTRLKLTLACHPTLLGFIEHCLIPYLYSYSHLIQYGELPFGELAHGADGLLDDLGCLYGAPAAAAPGLVSLTALRKRVANRKCCPCGSGRRLGTCHHGAVNSLRERLGRRWFRGLAMGLGT